MMDDVPPALAMAFDELRRVRATTQSVVLTKAAGRNFIRVGMEIGLSKDECVVLAFEAVALGNADWLAVSRKSRGLD
jgi:hypothetical protein